MGGSTFAIGLVPKYETIGFAAPLIVLLLRLLQGLALGGEYGGAATYVAERTFVIIFIPIAVGLVIFGYYALKGEYTAKQSSSGPDITID